MASIAVAIRYASNLAELKNNLSQALDRIEVTTAGANKLADSLGGAKMIQSAHNLVGAISQLKNGVDSLRPDEAATRLGQLERAMDKMQRVGQTVPTDMRKVADELRRVAESANTITPAPLDRLSERAVAAGSAIGSFLGNMAWSAVSNLTQEIGTFVARGAQLGGIERSFTRLATGIHQDSGEMLRAMQSASRGMVSEFDLMTAANKAMLLGLPVTSDSIRTMAESAVALGRAMGQSATKSIDDMITALGRSSPLILDNLGITVQVSEANDVYAARLGKTASQLSEAEKKTAFYEEAMRKAKDKTIELGEQTRTLGDIAVSVWTKFGDVVTNVAASMNTGVGAALSSTSNLKQFLADSYEFGIGQAVLLQNARVASTSAVRELTAEQKRVVDQMLSYGYDAKRISELIAGSNTASIQAYVSGLKNVPAPVKAATDAQKAYNKELDATVARWTKADLVPHVQHLQQALDRLQAKGLDSAEALAAVADDAEKLRKAGATLSPELQRVVRDFIEFNAQVDTSGKSMQKLLDKTKATRAEMAVPIPPPLPDAKELETKGIEISKLLGKGMGKGIDIEVPKVAAKLSTTLTNYLKTDLPSAVGDTLARAFEGGGDVLGAVKSLATQVGSTMGGMAGFAMGGPWGEAAGKAIGSLAGPIIGKVVGMFKNAGREAAVKFMDSFEGGAAGLREKLNHVVGGEQLWIQLTQGKNSAAQAQAIIDTINAKIKEQEAHVAAVTAAVEKYAFAFADKTPVEQLAEISEGLRTLQADHALLVESGLSTERATRAQATAYNELIAKSASVGTEMPLDLLKVTRELAQMGLLTEANTRALLGMKDQAVVDWKAMEDAAKKYNIPVEAMGDKFRAAKLGDEVRGLMADYELLTKGGADYNAVIAGMGDKFNSAAQDAHRYGVELPANMKPVLEAMLLQGKLTDENGNKLTDLSGIKFGETMAESTQKLLDKLDKLILALTTKVGGAAADAAAALEANLGGLSFNIPVNIGGAKGPTVETAHSGAMVARRIQRFHAGTARVLPFPSLASDEVPAILQTGEAVLRRQAVSALGADAIQALNGLDGSSARGASGSGSTVVDLSELRREVQALRQDQQRSSAQFPKDIARAVRDEFQKRTA